MSISTARFNEVFGFGSSADGKIIEMSHLAMKALEKSGTLRRIFLVGSLSLQE